MLPVKTIRVRAFRCHRKDYGDLKLGVKYRLRHRDKWTARVHRTFPWFRFKTVSGRVRAKALVKMSPFPSFRNYNGHAKQLWSYLSVERKRRLILEATNDSTSSNGRGD